MLWGSTKTPQGRLPHSFFVAVSNWFTVLVDQYTSSADHQYVSPYNIMGRDRDDIVAYYFKCRCCGEQFSLHAETYHGSGGYWEPVREATIREYL